MGPENGIDGQNLLIVSTVVVFLWLIRQLWEQKLSNAEFRLERFTEVREFTYLAKHFPCVNVQGARV